MKPILAPVLALAAVMASPLRAQAPTTVAEPSPEARQLAEALALDRIMLLELAPPDELRAGIERRLLNTILAPRGPGCDPANAECARAARTLAEREAPLMRARVRAAIDRAAAVYLDARLDHAELQAALAFVRQPAGRKFTDTLGDLGGVRRDRESATQLVPIILQEAGRMENSALLNEFYDMTAHLPRAELRVAPPAPRAPPRSPGD
jgi:hypothetical protein